jgi:dolichol-phosphate mannosyltransferase
MSTVVEEAPSLSVVIPVRNEADNVGPLVREIFQSLAHYGAFEVIFSDDASTDGTVEIIRALRREYGSQVRILRHSRGCGQSIAVWNGVRAARANWVVTMDGDGQNDPADIPILLRARDEDASAPKLILGYRRARKDNWIRRVSSRIANEVRNYILRDGVPDTGCGIKLFHRRTFLALPAFNHMHRFLPALFRRAGVPVTSVGVRHRPRLHGVSKYGLANRLWVGIVDLFGVRWLLRRAPALATITEE